MLNMGETIRRRRHALGMTQKQAAQRLGVSAAAVSKWELGASYPDVTLLPAIARLLDTDLNTLMGFERAPDRAQMNRLLAQVNDLAKEAGMEAGFERAAQILREYPGCGALLFGLAATLEGRMMMAGMTQAERAPYGDRLTNWYERAAQSDDEEAREAAASLLASRYLARGETGAAREMMARLPRESTVQRWPLEVSLLLAEGEGQQAQAYLQKRLFRCAGDIQQMLLRLIQAELDAGETDRAQAMADLTEAFVRLLGMHPYAGALAQLMCAMNRKDVGACIAHVSAMLRAFEVPWQPGACLPYERAQIKINEHTAKDMLVGIVREMNESEEYAFLREEAAFRALLAAHTPDGYPRA